MELMYNNSSFESDGALDFTATTMKSPSAGNRAEPPVLDLSCKKQEHEDAPSMGIPSPVSSDTLSNSHTMDTSIEDNYQQRKPVMPYGEDERKSPFEGRTFMVTPPSETDSPRKPKYEPIYSRTNGNPAQISESLNNRYSLLSMSLTSPVPVGTVPSSLLINQIGGPTIGSIVEQSVSTSATSSLADQQVASPMTSPEIGKKATRPFKAYPKDPLSLTMGSPELMYDPNSNEAYSEFRKRMLESVRKTNEGTNIKMRRVTKSPGLPTSTIDDKDAAYWERRRKNNEAAKRSRDARRAKEDEIAIRAAFLEQENIKLKYELAALRNETAKLRCMVYSN